MPPGIGYPLPAPPPFTQRTTGLPGMLQPALGAVGRFLSADPTAATAEGLQAAAQVPGAQGEFLTGTGQSLVPGQPIDIEAVIAPEDAPPAVAAATARSEGAPMREDPLPPGKLDLMEVAPGVRVSPFTPGRGDVMPGGSSNRTARMAAADVFDPEALRDDEWRASLDARFGTEEELAFDPHQARMGDFARQVQEAEMQQRLARARMSPRELANMEMMRNPQVSIFASTQERTKQILDEADIAIQQARADQRLTPEEREERVALIEAQRDRLVEQFNPKVRQD